MSRIAFALRAFLAIGMFVISVRSKKIGVLQPDLSVIVRICVKEHDRSYLACLGVYTDDHRVVASKDCLDYVQNYTVHLYMGSALIDCESGQHRLVLKHRRAKTHLIMDPFPDFVRSRKVSAAQPLRLHQVRSSSDLFVCRVYCNWRYFNGTAQFTDRGICGRKVDSRIVVQIPCPYGYAYNRAVSYSGNGRSQRIFDAATRIVEDGIYSVLTALPGNGRRNVCASMMMNGAETASTFRPSLSPVICADNVLFGFVNQNQTDFSILQMQPLLYEDAEESMKGKKKTKRGKRKQKRILSKTKKL